LNLRSSAVAALAASVSLFTAAVGTAAARPATPDAVSGAPAFVGVGNGSYTPPITSIYYRKADSAADTGSVTWSFENSAGAGNMSATDSTGLGLFDTGPRHASYKFTYVWKWAGTYPYHSTTTGTKGAIKVLMVRKPGTAALGKSFTFNWASAGRTNCVFDVEIKHQGAPHWSYLRFATAALSTTYRPRKTGWYAIRARMRNKVSNKFSGFSPAVLIHVT
jgi:hypothetical protein